MNHFNWKKLSNYFEQFPIGEWNSVFQNAPFPWSPLSRIKSVIENEMANREEQYSLEGKRTLLSNDQGELKEGAWWFTKTTLLQEDFVDPSLSIFIGKGSLVEAGTTVKDHSFIAGDCEIRQGAYIRGNVYVGPNCVVGHTTEIKNSIFIRHVEAGHYTYVGDTIIGSNVNLGAGTKISNLEFRTLEGKEKGLFPALHFQVGGVTIETGISKFGAIVGDGVETGCNSVLAPLTFLEPECWVLPNVCVLKGLYPKKSLIKSIDDCKRLRL